MNIQYRARNVEYRSEGKREKIHWKNQKWIPAFAGMTEIRDLFYAVAFISSVGGATTWGRPYVDIEATLKTQL